MILERKVLLFRFGCLLFLLFFMFNASLLGANSVRWLLWQFEGAQGMVIHGEEYMVNKLKGRDSGFYMVKVLSGGNEYLLKTAYPKNASLFNCKGGGGLSVHYFISGGYEDIVYKIFDHDSSEVCYLGNFDNRLSAGFFNFCFFFMYAFLSFFACRWLVVVPNIK